MVTLRKTLKVPAISDDMIEYLEHQFPDKLPPEVNYSEREVFMRLGTRRVVDHLRAIKRSAEKRNKD